MTIHQARKGEAVSNGNALKENPRPVCTHQVLRIRLPEVEISSREYAWSRIIDHFLALHGYT